MNLKLFAIISIILSAPLSGCLDGNVLGNEDVECTTLPAGHDNDAKLRILTYDVLALNDSIIEESE